MQKNMLMPGPSTEGALKDPNAQALLDALILFMKPIILSYTSHPGDETPQTDISLAGEEVETCGLKLVSALTEFISSAARQGRTREQPDKEIVHPQVKDVMATHNSEVAKASVSPAIERVIPTGELFTMTLTAVRAHIFNKMPIRLLAFDESGQNIKLIERDQVFGRILPGIWDEIATPYFQREWSKAEGMTDIFFTETWRQQKMSILLGNVIKKKVHYAILSHTWIRSVPGDVTYRDWKEGTMDKRPRGYAKITKFCGIAAGYHELTLGWIDSVCINKESSSELDESIRSMYNWYRGAEVCVTYLAETSDLQDAHNDSWFTRGWTLQELLAPVTTMFYNSNWQPLGSNQNPQVEAVLEKTISITKHELQQCRTNNIDRIPISRKMQLACKRQVTREEDAAYSLMGILGVDISTAYGEGAGRALYRIVRELIGTKKNIMDLFNRGYDHANKLIPTSLQLYDYRMADFDNTSMVSGSNLDEYTPLEPIILTHLGVRMPFLLAPGLLTADITDSLPLGDFSGTYSVDFTLVDASTFSGYYSLLDRRLYAEDAQSLPVLPHVLLENAAIQVMAIYNFGADNDGNILLPPLCASIALEWNGIGPGNITPLNPTIVPGSRTTISFKSAQNENTIPKSELEKHGFRLMTLYL